VDTNTSSDNGWRIASIPLQAISGLERTTKIVKELAFSGDAATTIYVGDLRIVNDSTPIHGEILNSQNLNLALGDTVTFRATGTGGASRLKYSWDFGTASQPEEDAVGQSVNRQFKKSGAYKVVLTISDYYNLKSPFTTSVMVKVN
jgi:PKD repeat protein